MTPLFSVIVPTCHRNDALAACLKRLAPGRQTLSTVQYEVIVTDDGFESTAEGMIQTRFPWARWVQGPRRGPAANRNCGASHAKADWLVFTDDDCLPDDCWLEAYRRGIAIHDSSHVFEGRVYADRPRQSLAETSPFNDRGGNLWSCNFSIWNQLFRDIRGFDERFRFAAMEDVELAKRLGDRQHASTFISGAAVCHPWRLSGGWKEILQHHAATELYLSLHPDERSKINWRVFLRFALRGFARDILPALVSLRIAGLSSALTQQMGSLLMALRLAVRPQVVTMAERVKPGEYRDSQTR